MADENDEPDVENTEDEDTEDAERRLKDAVDSEDTDDDESDSDSDDEELGEKGQRALDRMKAERKALKKAHNETLAKLKEYEDANKSESQRLTDDASSAKSRADKAEAKLLRMEVAMEKGLSAKQAARLSGDTKEELEEDADELLSLFKPADTEKKKPGGKPKEQLRGGGDPEEEPEETDPRKLAANISRNRY